MDDNYLTAAEVAQVFRTKDVGTVIRWSYLGKLPFIKTPEGWLYSRKEVEGFLGELVGCDLMTPKEVATATGVNRKTIYALGVFEELRFCHTPGGRRLYHRGDVNAYVAKRQR